MRAAVMIAALVLAACVEPPPPADAQRPLVVATAPDAGVCEDCVCKYVECGPDAGPPRCDTCVPACTSDDECLPGTTCVAGATCADTRCLCPNGLPPWEEDAENPCCEHRNANGVCCESGVVDPESGMCLCEDPYMVDVGYGCTCAPDMERDEETGVCRCIADGAEIEPGTGACLCPEGTWLHFDEYVGTVWCAGDDEPPPECADPHATFNPETGLCECDPGYVLANVDDAVTPFCAPPEEDGGPPARDAGTAVDAGGGGDAPMAVAVDAGVPPPPPIMDAAVTPVVRDAVPVWTSRQR